MSVHIDDCVPGRTLFLINGQQSVTPFTLAGITFGNNRKIGLSIQEIYVHEVVVVDDKKTVKFQYNGTPDLLEMEVVPAANNRPGYVPFVYASHEEARMFGELMIAASANDVKWQKTGGPFIA